MMKWNRAGKKTVSNGYYCIYMPEHPRAFQNGTVYEHILVAEEKLGRALNVDEVVHHIDHNRKNNDDDNLIVFRTSADHAKYHNDESIELVENEDGSMSVPLDVFSANNPHRCVDCGREISNDAERCSECYWIRQRKVERPSKEELEEKIKTTPFTTLALLYGVSDNAIRRWCKSYGLPYKKRDIDRCYKKDQ